MGKRAAVDLDCAVLFAEYGNVLVHDADRNTDEVVFRAPAKFRQFVLSISPSEKQCKRGRNLDGSRRTQTRAHRNGAVYGDVERLNRTPIRINSWATPIT